MNILRVLHAPINIGNQPWSLGQSERFVSKIDELNFFNHVVNFFPTKFSYQSDEVFRFSESSVINNIYRRILMASYSLKSLQQYDVFHFYFGKTFFPPLFKSCLFNYIDLKILNKLGKKCFMTFQGCDARLREVSKYKPISACDEKECKNKWCNNRLDDFKKNNIQILSKYCSHIFCLNPDLIPYMPAAEFLPYCIYNQDINFYKKRKCKKERLLIAHAPTDRDIKGTKYVLRAFENLRKSYPIDYVIIENLSHSKALDVYKEVDFAVDQLLVGWYGGFAVELMQMSIPVVANICSTDLEYIPKEMREEMPVIDAKPENIEEVLISLVKDREMLYEIGDISKKYVDRWHNAENIARSMIEIYKDPSKSFWDEFMMKI
ncbi:MAG: hypothetical protein A4E56_01271 [Pelotomaculum sp. PtaU1.Bin065]|nr:MAG: hypothetical protein A4E56_01271 [Pelotomaculum sp. PtaU1.Bin065]